jgi:hypothetical protein
MLDWLARTIPNCQQLFIFGAALLLTSGFTAAALNAQDMFGALEAQGAFASQQQNAASLHEQFSRRYGVDREPTRSTPTLTSKEYGILAAESVAREAKKEAEYQRWRAGSWQYFQSREPAEPGEFCTAMYQNSHGIITLMGVDRSWDGALLMFTGENIPKPRRFGEVTVTLTQSGDAPATIRAFNRAREPRMYDFGTLVIAVPEMEAALSGIEDQQAFALSIRGREVFRMDWKNGLQAAAELRKCLRER